MKLIDITGKAISGEWGNDCEDGNGIPVLRTTNFTDTGVINFANVVLRDIPPKDLSKKFLRPGDIIIEKSGGSDTKPVGRVAYFDSEENKYLINNFTGLLRVVDQTKWYPRYVFYALFANYSFGGTRQYENKTTGLHNLKLDQYLNSFDIPDVDFQLQHHIADTLDKVSEGIEVCRRMLGELDLMVKAKFVEMFGDPMLNPNRYALKKYGELFELNAGGTPSKAKPEYWENGIISWIGSNLCQNTILYENDGKYISQEGYEHSSARLFPVDTVLIALVGATIGKTALLKFETSTNQNVLGIRKIAEAGYNPLFVFYFTQFLYPKFLNIGDGGFNMASKGFVSELPMYDIDIEKQNEFAEFAKLLDKSKLTIQGILDKMETEKLALMQEYFG